MGNFSRDPKARADDAVGKGYVAVRLQQGVPILDADWNLLDDLRRRDAETLGGRFLGDGVPTGSDAFRVFSNGQPNDFGIKAGLLMVGGKVVGIGADTSYTGQPSFNNPAVTPTVGPLTTPGANAAFLAYLDTWEREVDGQADTTLIDARIGVETAVRVQRVWSVRVILLTDFPAALAAAPAGHLFYPLAQLNRLGGNAAIFDDMVVDARDTDASPRREVAYRRGASGLVLVDTAAFLTTMTTARENIGDFLVFLATKFVDPTAPYSAAEVMGVDTLRAVAAVADQGVALANSRVPDTRGALKLYSQLLAAEKRFLTVWQSVVLPLVKPSGTVYKNAFLGMINDIGTFVNGPAPAGFTSISDAIPRGNLLEAQRSQDQVNLLLSGQLNRPVGTLDLTYLGSTSSMITPAVAFDLRFRVSGSVTPDDTIGVDTLIDPAWKAALRNADGTTPFSLHMGPGADSKEFLVTVTPTPPPASTALTLRVFATHNSGGLQHFSGQLVLTVGSPPPPSNDQFPFSVVTTSLSSAGGNFQIPAGKGGVITFRLSNNTNTDATLAVDYTPHTQAGWVIQPPLGVSLPSNQVVGAHSQIDLQFQFLAPPTPGVSLSFRLTAKDAANTMVSQIQVSLVTT